MQTHALGLRRAVQGRKKSFDDLLKEHKAAKEALLRAKAEEQAALTGIPLVPHPQSGAPTLVTAVSSPAALAAVSAIKLGHSDVLLQRGDIKTGLTAGILSHSSLNHKLKPGQARQVFQR